MATCSIAVLVAITRRLELVGRGDHPRSDSAFKGELDDEDPFSVGDRYRGQPRFDLHTGGATQSVDPAGLGHAAGVADFNSEVRDRPRDFGTEWSWH